MWRKALLCGVLVLVALRLAACGESGHSPNAIGTVATVDTCPVANDTYVWSIAATNNFGHSQTSEVGREPTKSGGVMVKRSLVHFDLSALPADLTINGATLRLFIQSTSPNATDITVSRLQSSFVEGDGTTGVTWNTQPGIVASPTESASMAT